MAEDKKDKLFDMFEPTSTEAWKAEIIADLKGADFDKKLVWRTNEGFNVQPFYRLEDIKDLPTTNTYPGQFPFVRGTRDNNDWRIRQSFCGSVSEMNAEARHAIDRGCDSVGFKLQGEVNASDIDALLADIDIKKIEVNIDCCPRRAVEVAKLLVAYIQGKDAANDFRGSLSFNPFKRLLRHGLDFNGDIAAVACELLDVVKPVENLRCLAVDSVMFCNAGAFITQELGYALAWGA